MEPSGPRGVGPASVPWDEAREILVIVLLFCAGAMAIAPIIARLIDGQLDRNGLASATTGAGPTTGLAVLGASVLVATTPGDDVVPMLRTAAVRVAQLVALIGAISVLETLFSPAAGGFRGFLTRFPTILRFSGPGMILALTAAWTARRVVPFPRA